MTFITKQGKVGQQFEVPYIVDMKQQQVGLDFLSGEALFN